MSYSRSEIDEYTGRAAKRVYKKAMRRKNRLAAKRDPENAPRRNEYKGWVT